MVKSKAVFCPWVQYLPSGINQGVQKEYQGGLKGVLGLGESNSSTSRTATKAMESMKLVS